MTKTFLNYLEDESGATAIEYGLIAALVSVAAVAALTQLGGSLTGIFNIASGKLDEAAASATTSTTP